MSFDGVPILGLEPSPQERLMHGYITQLDAYLKEHQVHVGDCVSLLNREFADAKKEERAVQGVYVEVVQSRLATHAAAVSQITGQFALMAAMGITTVPVPIDPGEVFDKESLN